MLFSMHLASVTSALDVFVIFARHAVCFIRLQSVPMLLLRRPSMQLVRRYVVNCCEVVGDGVRPITARSVELGVWRRWVLTWNSVCSNRPVVYVCLRDCFVFCRGSIEVESFIFFVLSKVFPICCGVRVKGIWLYHCFFGSCRIPYEYVIGVRWVSYGIVVQLSSCFGRRSCVVLSSLQCHPLVPSLCCGLQTSWLIATWCWCWPAGQVDCRLSPSVCRSFSLYQCSGQLVSAFSWRAVLSSIFFDLFHNVMWHVCQICCQICLGLAGGSKHTSVWLFQSRGVIDVPLFWSFCRRYVSHHNCWYSSSLPFPAGDRLWLMKWVPVSLRALVARERSNVIWCPNMRLYRAVPRSTSRGDSRMLSVWRFDRDLLGLAVVMLRLVFASVSSPRNRVIHDESATFAFHKVVVKITICHRHHIFHLPPVRTRSTLVLLVLFFWVLTRIVICLSSRRSTSSLERHSIRVICSTCFVLTRAS